MLDGFDGQIDVQIRPVEMIFLRPENVKNLGHRSLCEPREISERHEDGTGTNVDRESLVR